MLASHIGTVLGVAVAPISFGTDGSTTTLTIGDLADVKIATLIGQGGVPVTVTNHPLAVAPGFEATAARSDHLRYTDHGYQWELSNKSGLFSPFSYQG